MRERLTISRKISFLNLKKKSFKKDLTNKKESLRFVKQNRKNPKEFFEKLNYPFRMFDDETLVVDFE